MKEKKKQYRSRWSIGNLELPLLAKIVLPVALLACAIILSIYAIKVGPGISSKPENWGFFGALLSGIFGMLASFAAVATFWMVLLQFKEQGKIIEKQIESMEFDRYDRHRRIFFERLAGIEQTYNKTLTIKYQEELYKRVFPLNSPLNCDVKINLDEKIEEKKSRIILYKRTFERIKAQIDETKDINENILWKLLELQRDLGVIRRGKMELGDVSLEDERTTINIYEITSSMHRIWSIINNILEYGGNAPIAGKYYVVLLDDDIADSTVRTVARIRDNQERGSFKISTDNNKLFLLYEKIYSWLIGVNEKNSNYSATRFKNKIRDILFDEDGMRQVYTESSEKIEEIINSLHTRKRDTKMLDEDEDKLRLEFIAELESQVTLLSAQGQ
ncbi:hypothetical protein [Billgrantia kenyensis]|uniref:Uncharacterized protein n=1 Tax=Billgrantia kenyensis TaxID=321266 RepID=A0A7V9W329_9GAMM|nr:hypothetical protein [Halomonas kenyensis]MBA2780182.1 hypothetical protein [Halomonas kenyensis]MCG6663162.1 hypothetical protein [Halomonas kenyensis]